MNWEAIGALGEVVGATAVVVTLAYLRFQVRVSLKATRSQTLLETSIQYQNLVLAPSGNALIQCAFEKLDNSEAMTSAERIALAGWCNAMMNFLEATWIQVRIPDEGCHLIHGKVATHSTGRLPPIPEQSCHP